MLLAIVGGLLCRGHVIIFACQILLLAGDGSRRRRRIESDLEGEENLVALIRGLCFDRRQRRLRSGEGRTLIDVCHCAFFCQ